jgi:hypothetical protein
MKTLRIFTVLLGLTTSMSAMEDTPNNRARAADQFLQIYSVQETLAASFNKISQTMPQPKRDMFESVISHLDMQAVSHVMRQSLIANFTADDLNALSDFLSTPAGKSILEKFSSGRYMDLSTRDIQVYNDFFGTKPASYFWQNFANIRQSSNRGLVAS